MDLVLKYFYSIFWFKKGLNVQTLQILSNDLSIAESEYIITV